MKQPNKQIIHTGGARIGIWNASFPLAKLVVNPQKIELRAGILGSFVFQANDIVKIEPFVTIPLLMQGIQIHHQVSTYKERIIFYTFDKPENLIMYIKETGFLDQTSPLTSSEQQALRRLQQQGGLPFQSWAAIGGFVFFILLQILAVTQLVGIWGGGPSIGVAVAPGAFLLIICLLLLISKGTRNAILKEGRTLKEVKGTLLLLIFVAIAFMVTMLTLYFTIISN